MRIEADAVDVFVAGLRSMFGSQAVLAGIIGD
jgi:hypothetical protein